MQPSPNQNIVEVSPASDKGNQLFPVFIKLNELRTLLVGAGNVGLEKLNAIVNNSEEAKVTVVAQEINAAVFEIAASKPNVKIKQKAFTADDLDDVDIVFAATNDNTFNAELRSLVHQKGLLINVADKPELCDFYLGSIVQKGDLKIAISTNGKSPTIAKRLKEILNDGIPNELDQTLQNMSALRQNLSGDFTAKVKKLNKVTERLVNPQKSFAERNIKWLIWLVAVAFILAVGFTLWETEPQFQAFLTHIDPLFYWFLGAGFVFAMIDGAIGMSYGVTSASFSLAMGLPPASASMAIHISEVMSNGIAGWMHYKMGNVNWKLFKILIVPAIIGAILGAYILSSLEHYSAYVKPIVGIYTLFLGVVILVKAFNIKRKRNKEKIKKIGPLGFVGGFIDAAFGGGWGSIVLSSLIAGGRHPLFSLGTVKISRFFIATLSSLTFFTMLGGKYWEAVLGLVIGSALASPIAARVSNKISAKTIMVAVGIIVILVSLRSVIMFILKLI
ncbi:TSUP family transporter [Pedobacter chitinilyticus]|uniref:Probable membrane transporter protein n=1 Tax=Pedobacter chitinilyticus TaxID=2233776 RepID=A0A3S3STP0_9SPHI|nr:TSUP family transporter [Pedobacter chitinilyticus]RWU10121.1 siroheme synthase [Pedobacter chitinilyticus]